METAVSRPRGGAALVAAAGLTVAFGASAEWIFEPAAEIRTIASDNIQARPEGQEDSDLVGVVSPSFSLRREDDTLDIGLDYRLEAVGYLENDAVNQIFQQIDAGLGSALFNDHLFINVGAALFQQVADPENPFINNNIGITGNRTDTLSLDLGVTWRQTIGDTVDIVVSHSESRFEFDLPTLIDTQTSSTNFSVGSPQTGQGVTWSLTGNLDRIEFSQGLPEAEFSTLLAELGYWVTPNVRTFASGGVESDFLEHRRTIEYDTAIWTVGFDWMVADRDQLTISYGRRVFGNNLNASWLHRLGEKLELSVDYIEVPSTNPQSARNQLQGIGDIASQGGLETLVGLDRPSSADSFVRRRASVGFRANGNRLSFGINGFYERRTDRVNAVGIPLDVDDEDVRGGTAFVQWDPGAKTRVNAQITWESANFANQLETERLLGVLGVDYALGTRTDLTLEYRRFDGGATNSEFIENRISLILGRRF